MGVQVGVVSMLELSVATRCLYCGGLWGEEEVRGVTKGHDKEFFLLSPKIGQNRDF